MAELAPAYSGMIGTIDSTVLSDGSTTGILDNSGAAAAAADGEPDLFDADRDDMLDNSIV